MCAGERTVCSVRGASIISGGFPHEFSAEESRDRARNRRSRTGRWWIPRTRRTSAVNVTGTNIKRVDAETAAPIETITREDIQASGLQTIQEVVRQITANNNGSIAPSFTNGFSASGTAVSLRGLGPNNTLVLVNGRRLANFGLADDGHVVVSSTCRRSRSTRSSASKSSRTARPPSTAPTPSRRGQRDPAPAVHRRHRNGRRPAQPTTARRQRLQGVGHRRHRRPHEGQLQRVPVRSTTRRRTRSPAIPAGTTSAATTCGSWAWRTSGSANTALRARTEPAGHRAAGQPDDGGLAGCRSQLAHRATATRSTRAEGFCRSSQRTDSTSRRKVERFNVYGARAYNFTPDIQGYTEAVVLPGQDGARATRRRDARPTGTNRAVPQVQSSVNIFLPVGHPDNPFNATNQGARLYYATGAGRPRRRHRDRDAALPARPQGHVRRAGTGTSAGLYIKSDTDVTRNELLQLRPAAAGIDGHGPVRLLPDRREREPEQPGDLRLDRAGPRVERRPENTIFDAKGSRDSTSSRAASWRWPSATST